MAAKQHSTNRRTAYDGPIPGHVRELAAMATRAGMAVSIVRGFESDYEEEQEHGDRILTRLVGTEVALRRTGFLRDRAPIPIHQGWAGQNPFQCWITRTAANALEAVLYNEPPCAIRKVVSGVEEMTYADQGMQTNRRGIWGAPREIERLAGLSAGSLERRGRASKSGGSLSRGWSVQHFPSGNALYRGWSESPALAEITSAQQYSDPKSFAREQEHNFDIVTRMIIDSVSGRAEGRNDGECTIRYDTDTVAQIKDAFDDALIALQAATPRFVGPKAQEAKQLAVARANPEFQAFLKALVAKGGPKSDKRSK